MATRMRSSEMLDKLSTRIKNQADFTQEQLAGKLAVTSKTLYNWMKDPDKHPIPLEKFLQLCDFLGEHPDKLFVEQGSTQIESRLGNGLGVDKRALQLEQALQAGDVKSVVYPLWSPPLMTPALVMLSGARGSARKFSLSPEATLTSAKTPIVLEYQEYCRLRVERSKAYRDQKYVMKLIFTKNEFEAFIRGKQLFKDIADTYRKYGEFFDPTTYRKYKDYFKDPNMETLNKSFIKEQLEHLIELLKIKDTNGNEILLLRMTTYPLRMYYSIFGKIIARQDASNVMINSNTGLFFTDDLRIINFLREEFAGLWNDNAVVFRDLHRNDVWIDFFQGIIDDYLQPQGVAPDYLAFWQSLADTKDPEYTQYDPTEFSVRPYLLRVADRRSRSSSAPA